MHKDSKLVTLGRPAGAGGHVVNPPVERASTVVFPTLDAYEEAGRNKFNALRYGRHGTSTLFALQEAVAELEGGHRAIAMPSGVAAIAATLMAVVKAGDHLLVADSVYGPTRDFCNGHLTQIGAEITYYDPRIGAGIAALMQPNTVAVYCESPGSGTFEVQDIPAIATAAHAQGALVINDNTWATPYFFASFDKGVDISLHAGTKYIVGHSDVMLGLAICTEEAWAKVRPVVAAMGYSVSPDDAYLALRGMRTLGVRLERHQKNALAVAEFLASHEKVTEVLHPALPTHPDHALWARDFTGASGLFALRLKTDRAGARAMADGLRLFGIGSSWGGFESLVTLPKPARSATPVAGDEAGILMRLHVGLEDPADLIADLATGLEKLKG